MENEVKMAELRKANEEKRKAEKDRERERERTMAKKRQLVIICDFYLENP